MADTTGSNTLKLVDPPAAAITTGGPGDGGGVETRVARLESDVAHILVQVGDIKTDVRELRAESNSSFGEIRGNMRVDYRILFSAIIVAAIGLAGIMASGFGWIGGQ